MKKLLLTTVLTASAFAYTNCAKCHSDAYKPLNKLTSAYIVKTLNEYKAGKKYGMMNSIIGSMNEADIKDAAKKYGKK